MNQTTDSSQFGVIPKINGSVNIRDEISNFFVDNATTPFIAGAQTAQDQIANGTVLGDHVGVTQGYLTYAYYVINPTNNTVHKVIVDTGNGQVLYTSEDKQIGSWGQTNNDLKFMQDIEDMSSFKEQQNSSKIIQSKII